MNRLVSFSLKNPTVFRLILPAILVLNTACEKVLDIKLKDSEARLIVEGNISDQPGPYEVTLSRSVNFNSPNTFPGVSGARVIISDNAGNADTLEETSEGRYVTQKIQGVPGRTYFLRIETDNQVYTATSEMPLKVPALTVTVENPAFTSTRLFPRVKFQDQAGERNFYRLLLTVNDTLSNRLYFLEDKYVDGKLVDDFIVDRDIDLKSGDLVLIILQAIDEPVLRYLREEDLLDNGQAASPANPTSNLSNGALGYFSAHVQTFATVTVP